MKKLTGNCLCGKIAYEITGDIGETGNCHCSLCRRWHGSAFRSRTFIRTEQFRWIRGEEFLGKYNHTGSSDRTFCKNCGSSLVSLYLDQPEKMGIPMGTLNEDPGKKPAYHIYVDSKAPWFEITDNLPQYSEKIPT